MKKKIFAMLMAASMLLSLTACGGSGNSSDANSESQTTSASDTVEAENESDNSTVIDIVYEGNMYDINELYQAILAEQPEDMEPLDLVNESENQDLIMKNYPNFYNYKFDDILYYVSHSEGSPCEIMIVQTKNEHDAEHIEEEFLARIEMGAADETSPENADSWANLAEIQRDGIFVVMIVLPEGYEIPYVFGLI